MRLSEQSVQAVKAAVQTAFPGHSKLLLFGSRVADNKRGGDIDLLVESALREGAAHLLRLVAGTQQLAPAFPLAPGALAGLADETVALLDQFIYRFANGNHVSCGARLL